MVGTGVGVGVMPQKGQLIGSGSMQMVDRSSASSALTYSASAKNGRQNEQTH